MNRDVLRKVARKNNTTVKEVRTAIQEALDYADQNACHDELARERLENIYGDNPHTPENFIAGVTEKIKKQMKPLKD